MIPTWPSTNQDLDPAGPLRAACRADPRPWEVIAGLAKQLGDQVPADLGPEVDEARRRTACRAAVEKAVQARSLRQLAGAYDPVLLDDWFACAPLLPMAREARTLLAVLERLEALVQDPGDGRALLALWNEHAQRLGEYVESERVGQEAAAWRLRIETCDAFLAVVQSPLARERAIAGTWARLQRAGGHPDAAPFSRQGELARPRADLVDRLKVLPAVHTETNDRQFDRTWDESLLGDSREAAELRPRLAEVRARLAAVDALYQAVAQADRGGDEQAVVDAAEAVCTGYAPELEDRIEEARRRAQAAAQLTGVLAAVPLSDCALADAWEKTEEAVRDRRPRREVERCLLAVRRRDCLRRLKNIDNPALPDVEQDQRWVLTWKADLLKDCADAKPLQARCALARKRLARLEALRQVIARADRGTQPQTSMRSLVALEQAVVDAAVEVPSGYAPELEERVGLARRRVATAADLDRALAAEPVSDCALAEAWEKAEDAGRDRRSRQEIDRCLLAVRRRDCLRDLHGIDDPALPVDEQDERWLAAWDDDLLKDCEDARPLQARCALARKRLADWKVLEEVLRTRDLVRIREAATAPSLKDFPRMRQRAADVEQLLGEAEGIERLLERLAQPDAGELLSGADLQYIRAHAHLLGSKKEQIEAVLRDWLGTRGRLGPGTPSYLQPPDSDLVTVRWTWPHFERISHCLVAVSPDRFCATPAEAPDGVLQWTAADHRRCGGGAGLRGFPGKSSLYVTVWPAIDLGWTLLVGPPLNLGPIPASGPSPGEQPRSWFYRAVQKVRRRSEAGADDS